MEFRIISNFTEVVMRGTECTMQEKSRVSLQHSKSNDVRFRERFFKQVKQIS